MISNEDENLKYIVTSYTQILFNFISRYGFDKEEIEDILQDIFIKVWKNLDNFDDNEASFRTWIFTIAKNTVYDFLRKKKRQKIIFSLDEEDKDGIHIEIEDIKADIIKILENDNKRSILIDAINSLTVEEKTILLLHFEEGLTFLEISKVFNLSLNTIKSKYRRSLIKLKDIILHQKSI